MISALFHSGDGTTEVTSDTWRDAIAHHSYDAFIFDCDGTLVESAEVHFKSFFQAAAEQGHTLERDWYLARTGLDRVSLFREFAADVGRFDIQQASKRSIEFFVGMSDQVRRIPETALLVEALGASAPLAVGTNAERPVAEASLRATGLLQHFDHIVAISDGLKPKPAPDIFRTASDLLQSGDRVLVIEDSPQGVAAARSAGFDVIEIVSLS